MDTGVGVVLLTGGGEGGSTGTRSEDAPNEVGGALTIDCAKLVPKCFAADWRPCLKWAMVAV